LNEVFSISQDNIEIMDSSLEDKLFRMTFRNFGKYMSLTEAEREKTVKKMRKWIAKYGMKEVRHDQHNGDLVVEVDN
jgi:exonuclease I